MTDHNQHDGRNDGRNDGAGSNLDCEVASAQLSEYLDGQLSPSDAAAYTRHLASCAVCATLERELRAVVSSARSLPAPPMPRDLWPEIAARLETPVLSLPLASQATADTPAASRGQRFARSWQFMAAAAALLVTLSAGVTWSIAQRSTDSATDPALVATNDTEGDAANGNATNGNASASTADLGAARRIDAQAVPPVATTEGTGAANPTFAASSSTGGIAGAAPATAAPTPGTRAAGRSTDVATAQLASNIDAASLETIYGREIAMLRTVAESQLGLLDSSTVNVVRRNLDIIDEAIRECRTALADDPNSGFLLDQLGRAYDRKVDLLRRLALL